MPQAANKDSVLLHLMPAQVLRELAAHARRLQQEEAIQRFALRRVWFILPMTLLIVVIGLVSAWVVAFAVAAVLALVGIKAMPAYVAALVFLGPPFIVCMTVVVLLLNNLLSWVESRASASNL